LDSLNHSIIKSLDGTDENLLPFIPYLFQDLWEMGSSPEVIIRLLSDYNCVNNNSRILDLGCGKGSISVSLAREFACQVLGIDAMPEFIEEARYRADKYHQTHLCTFEEGDIRKRISEFKNFDLVILGSIGAVFGNIETTLNMVKPCLITNGYVVLDDGYIPDNSTYENENYLKKSETDKQIQNAGFRIVEPFILDYNYIAESDTDIYQKIKIRALEMIKQYPNKKKIFEEYLRIQRIENDILENKIECVTWLLRKN
jgi:2-polyprenyl-3-methyl-5-hydroxy-6-metoxy-1,4-benzoquinol methylase